MATINSSLSFNIFARYHGDGAFRRARNDIDGLNNRLNRLDRNTRRGASGMSVLIAACAALAPALVPIGAGLLAVAGGLAAAAAGAAAAGGIWGAAAMGAVKHTEKMRKEMAKLKTQLDQHKSALASLKPGTAAYKRELAQVTQLQAQYGDMLKSQSPQQRQYIKNMDALSSTWERFISKTEAFTLGPISTVLGAVNRNMMKLVPVVKAVGGEAQYVADQFANWLDHGGLDRFVKFLLKFGVPTLHSFMNAGREMLGFLGKGMRDFAPLGLRIVDILAKGAAALKRWADGGGFQRFLTYVNQNKGNLQAFFKALWDAFKNIARTMKIMAPLSMAYATALARIVAALPPPVLVALIHLWLAWKLAVMVFGQQIVIAAAKVVIIKLAVAAWTAVQWLLNAALLANPIVLIIAGIALLVVAVVLIATKTRWFQTAWKFAWVAIKAVASAVWGFMGGKFKWLLLIIGPIGWLLFLLRNWRLVWNGIKAVTNAVWTFLHNRIFMPIVRFFTQTIPNAATSMGRGVTRAWHATWNGVRGAYNSMLHNVFQPIGRFFTKTIPGWGTSLKNKLVDAFKRMVSGIKHAWNLLKGVVAAPVKFFVNTVYNNGLRKAWNNTAGKIPGVPDLPQAKLGFATGGHVQGPGTGTSDSIHAMLSAGEYVVNANAVRRIGVQNLNALNGGGGGPTFRGGGTPGFFLGGIIPNPLDLLKKAGGAAMGVLKWGANVAKDLAKKALKLMFKPIKGLVNSITSRYKKSGMFGTAIKQFVNSGLDKMLGFAVSKAPEFGSFGVGGKIPAGQHRAVIMAALKAAHVPPPGTLAQWLVGMNTLISRESGWNAGAINRTDSNAKAGHPSQGLAQTIPSTFSAYVPSSLRHLGILNPVANVAAAIRYIVARYGNITRVQQANSHLPPKGYRHGGMAVNSFDQGGYLPEGLSLAYNGTGKPEPVGHGLGHEIHIHGNVYTKSEREFENMLVGALKEVKRKGRMP